VDLYFSPTAPKRFEKNWIPTVPGQAWFTCLCLYGPAEAYFDKTWKLPDIEKVKIATIKRIPNEPSDFIKRSRQQQAYSSCTLIPG
jgi:hypothetical protein